MKRTSFLPLQAGISLVEVLVAIVIIAFGLLGVASLQITGLKNNQSAFYRTSATFYANDMLDRMRVNRKGLINGDYDSSNNFYSFTSNKINSPTTMAQKDLNDWLLSLEKNLPEGKGKIEAAGGASTIRVTIQWNDKRGTQGSGTQTLSVESQGCVAGDPCNF